MSSHQYEIRVISAVILRQMNSRSTTTIGVGVLGLFGKAFLLSNTL